MRNFLSLAAIALVLQMSAGCGSPTPTPVVSAPPPPPAPPAPPPMPKPIPQLEPPKPDPYETAMTEVTDIFKRYSTQFAGVKDQATADQAAAEIAKMTSRLKELADQISKLPPQPGREKYAMKLHADVTQISSAQLTNPDMQRVLGDPEIGLKVIVAHQSFLSEGVLPLAQAMMTSATPQPAAPAAPATP
jgi:hypothetical protein